MNLPSNDFAHHQRGFSLLEILVAFSILALSLGVLFQIYSRGANVTALSRDYSTALIVAQSQLAMFDREQIIELGEQNGSTETGITWQRRVFAYEDEEEISTRKSFRKSYHLVHVEVEVNWETQNHPHNFTLTSLRLTEEK